MAIMEVAYEAATSFKAIELIGVLVLSYLFTSGI
jgi:hypothetical protein